MKAKELAEILLENPDYEVQVCYWESPTWNSPWPKCHSCDIDGVEDIGHSDKVIVLSAI